MTHFSNLYETDRRDTDTRFRYGAYNADSLDEVEFLYDDMRSIIENINNTIQRDYRENY